MNVLDMALEEYPDEDHIDPEDLNSCDKSESDLDTDKLRIASDPNEEVVYCKHCGNWVTHEEYDKVDLGDISTGVSS